MLVLPSRQARAERETLCSHWSCSARLHVGTHTHWRNYICMYKRFILGFGTCSLSLCSALLLGVCSCGCILLALNPVAIGYRRACYAASVCVCAVHSVCCIYCLFAQLEMISFQNRALINEHA